MAMNQILIDTNAYAALKTGDTELVRIIRHVDIVGLNSIVLGELLAGFAHGNKEQQNRNELAEFINSSRVTVFPIAENTAKYYASIYANLRKKGAPIPTNDMWIAATALEHGLMLCSYDKHFVQIEGLLFCQNISELVL
jgi:tRNA(fMet)-specific endonuclease VapC